MTASVAPVDRQPSRRLSLAAFAGVALVVSLVYGRSYLSLVEVWQKTEAYSHCWLIVPIAAVIIWQKREELANVQVTFAPLGVPVLLLISAAWYLSSAVGIQFLEQFTAVSIVPALAYTLLGPEVFRSIRFALLYLVFAVPFGDFLIPYLIDFTAGFCVDALNVLGIPVLREGRFFRIPTGYYEVAKACSGLKFFIATFALTTLYAYYLFEHAAKRAAFVAFSLVLAVIMNGIRATSVVLILHFSDFDIAAGEDHAFVGLVLFALMLLILVAVGWRFQDKDENPGEHAAAVPQDAESGAGRLVAWSALALLASVAGPLMIQSANDPAGQGPVDEAAANTALPANVQGWTATETVDASLRPLFVGFSGIALTRYARGDTDVVDVALVKYSSRRQGSEVSSSTNKVVDTRVWQMDDMAAVSVVLENGVVLPVRELNVSSPGETRLVWYWFSVNDRSVSGTAATKLAELGNFVRGVPSLSSAIIVSTPVAESRDESRDRLHRFMNEFHLQMTVCLGVGSNAADCSSGAPMIKEG